MISRLSVISQICGKRSRSLWFAATLASTSGCIFSTIPSDVNELPPITVANPAIAKSLRGHVEYLSHTIGSRSYQSPEQLTAAANYVKSELDKSGYTVDDTSFRYKDSNFPKEKLWKCYDRRDNIDSDDFYEKINRPVKDTIFSNLVVDIPGTDETYKREMIIIGAHYDSDACESRGNNAGANDNGSGVAVLIELAKLLKDSGPKRTIRLIAFTNEEEPFFQTNEMGSFKYLKQHSVDNPIKAMVALDTMGYFDDSPKSQKPTWLARLLGLPTRGNFIAFVSDMGSESLVRKSINLFRDKVNQPFPAVGIAAHRRLLDEVSWSDHWSFWRRQVPAIMVTDTAAMRYPCYHKHCDTYLHLDYERLAIVAGNLRQVIVQLADPQYWP